MENTKQKKSVLNKLGKASVLIGLVLFTGTALLGVSVPSLVLDWKLGRLSFPASTMTIAWISN